MKFLFVLTMLISTTAVAANDCFSSHRVRGYSTRGHNEIVVDTGRQDYLVRVGFCSELPWAHRIAFDGFGSRVCRGDRVLILDNFFGTGLYTYQLISSGWYSCYSLI